MSHPTKITLNRENMNKAIEVFLQEHIFQDWECAVTNIVVIGEEFTIYLTTAEKVLTPRTEE